MDSGRFESVSKPYAFHQVMKSMFVPLRLATNARQLEFITELDENIDKVSLSLIRAHGLFLVSHLHLRFPDALHMKHSGSVLLMSKRVLRTLLTRMQMGL